MPQEKNRKNQDEASTVKDQALEEARRDDRSRWERVYGLIDNDPTAESSRMLKLLIGLKNKGLH